MWIVSIPNSWVSVLASMKINAKQLLWQSANYFSLCKAQHFHYITVVEWLAFCAYKAHGNYSWKCKTHNKGWGPIHCMNSCIYFHCTNYWVKLYRETVVHAEWTTVEGVLLGSSYWNFIVLASTKMFVLFYVLHYVQFSLSCCIFSTHLESKTILPLEKEVFTFKVLSFFELHFWTVSRICLLLFEGLVNQLGWCRISRLIKALPGIRARVLFT